ncbi:hypothetical protein LQL77_32790, partial [Rhodococcus cerastii]|nr:hypothetical protein [Rhodococcus cerastii]
NPVGSGFGAVLRGSVYLPVSIDYGTRSFNFEMVSTYDGCRNASLDIRGTESLMYRVVTVLQNDPIVHFDRANNFIGIEYGHGSRVG